ncbi:dUTPase [Candidatus Mycoplasma haematobovis]|uniref:dUTPase n=1 Tax=Candidatus Mycoplasma haematobovis TaxID=432608 RepID=A0A1A9QD70_9MOLU|nr:dUTP diphosphatase [Candidatus Mycoplasma haematobovis]OAL10178.1 dUTPase [Candidatus Mycoplasma haematobovis]
MSIDWVKFLEGQTKLDQYIFERKGLNYQETSQARLLALIVELNELANATKVFKFWSEKEGSKEDALAEYADVLHFLLTFSLEKKYSLENISFPIEKLASKEKLINLFLKLNALAFFESEIEFRTWVENFLLLGAMLGFNFKEIEEAYWHKWKINFERQNNSY